MAPDMHPIQSSNIAAVGHDGEALLVQFRNGATYRYPTAEASHVEAMKSAESPGSYFHLHVKSKHTGSKVDGAG